MKKSIGILAAVLLSASVFSQESDSASQRSLSSTPESGYLSNQQSESAAPGRAEFDAQSSLRANSEQDSEKQGLTLSDEEAADALRNSDDPDLANRNQELTNPDPVTPDDSSPDMIYEEWILITPPDVQCDVGAPGESESGSSSSSSENNRRTESEIQSQYERDYPGFEFDWDNQTRDLNESRIYNGTDSEAVGGPAQSQSGAQSQSDVQIGFGHDDDLCLPGDQKLNEGSAPSFESNTDSQPSEPYHTNPDNNLDSQSQGSAAGSQSDSSRSGDASDVSDRRDTDVPAVPDL